MLGYFIQKALHMTKNPNPAGEIVKVSDSRIVTDMSFAPFVVK